MFLKAYFKRYNFPYIVGNSQTLWKHQQLYRIIPKTILCILQEKNYHFKEMTLLKETFFIEDFCNGIFKLIKKVK